MQNNFDTQFDIPEMLDVYLHHNNYEILELNKKDNRCIIYFSSNGLYFPNEQSVFHRDIVLGNRFEWKKNILYSANKAIFLRDVQKQWYLEGINFEINSIDKLVSFLRDQTIGLDVICVGNSAGGYAATLIGHLLGASHVFNFCGQFSILESFQTELDRIRNPICVKFENDIEYNKYYSIVQWLNNSKTQIFYFYPYHSTQDIFQSELAKDLKNVFQFRFDSGEHGSTCYEINFLDIFSQSREKVY